MPARCAGGYPSDWEMVYREPATKNRTRRVDELVSGPEAGVEWHRLLPGGRNHFGIEDIVFHVFSVEICRRHTLATARRTRSGRGGPMSRASRVVSSTIAR